MNWYANRPPPPEMKRIQVSHKVLMQLAEQVHPYHRISYDMDGYPNYEIAGIIYHTRPRND